MRILQPGGGLAHRIIFDGTTPMQLLAGASALVLHGLRDDGRPYEELEEHARGALLSLTCHFASQFVGALLSRYAGHLPIRTRLVRSNERFVLPVEGLLKEHWMLEVWGVVGSGLRATDGGGTGLRKWALVDVDHKLIAWHAGTALSALECVQLFHRGGKRPYRLQAFAMATPPTTVFKSSAARGAGVYDLISGNPLGFGEVNQLHRAILRWPQSPP